MNLDPYLVLFTKINLKVDNLPNIRAKVIKHAGENRKFL